MYAYIDLISRAIVFDSMNVGKYEGVVATIEEYLQCALTETHEVKLDPIQLKVYAPYYISSPV